MNPSLEEALAEAIRAEVPWMVELRRSLHRWPELRYQEERTAARLKAALEEVGLAPRTGVARTGVVALLEPSPAPGSRGAKRSRRASGRLPVATVALRADMDALPIQEETGLPYASERSGIMHACGHDAHCAVVAGVARALARTEPLRRALKGRIKFVFQPAEEGGLGAQAMIDAGVLADPPVDAILGFHVFPGLPTGELSVYRACSHASADGFTITLRGKGGHAGYPHLCADPLGPACELALALRTLVAREVDPLDAAVITVASLRAGEAHNVVPESAELRGTIRCLDAAVRARLKARLGELAEHLAAAHRVTAEVHFDPGCPPTRNDPRVAGMLAVEATRVLGAGAVRSLPPAMGAEDFACFTQVVPGAMFRLGCSPRGTAAPSPLHSPRFQLDERALEIAALVLARTAAELLESGLPAPPPGTPGG